MKPHYPILDGLRGTAALLVVIFHLIEAFYPDVNIHPMHHAFLAVDFFFLLSGFVIGYAYDDRWGSMTFKDFFKIRLVRLHPLVIVSAVIAGVCILLDPYTESIQKYNFLQVAGISLLAMTLLPVPDVRGWNETHSINGPFWSLLQEYIANFIYAVVGRKLSSTALWILVTLSAAALIVTASWRGNLGTGWGYDTFWIAFVRMMFPFFGGLLLFRAGKLIRIPNAYLFCSVALTVLFCLPTFRFNGLYEAACIIIAFPMIVAAGAGGTINGRWAKLCKFSGDISYPIYILHYPFIYIYTSWIYAAKPDTATIWLVSVGLVLFFVLLAYALLKLYDEPVRQWLRRKFLIRKTVS
ncbi:acyltransferase [Flavobacterium sp. DG1-102-2]|uniref:acyltransferase family protein n=1 Tax=Flavobacterium sp. DG1-102-2 TaxID=3081663 RepID=UPI00294A54B3|nr:acyltransferase [Flavobacterium sp. DG1-102-2]MDV6169057.1 acyltransferase [Flavobacterium sp. DG1-102-2]